ncbi:MAG TPA: hypothetical protein ACFYD6_07170 [Candidatus Brocadiia bacterium]|nr:hypothetical protein [Candidatus Brocadiales bacterium]
MMTDLTNDILGKFLSFMKQDQFIGEDLAEKIHESISNGKYTKEHFEAILKKANENS